MLRLSRVLISSLALGFGTLLAIFGLMHLNHFDNKPLVAGFEFAYIAALALSLSLAKSLRMPIWLAATGFVLSLAIPAITHVHHHGPAIGDYDTWYVTAVAILLSVIAVRGYQVLAIVGAVALFVEVFYFGGLAFLPVSGITGAELLIFSCVAIAIGLQRAAKDIDAYQKQTIEQQAQQSEQAAAIDEHDASLAKLMAQVQPALNQIAKSGKLSKADRAELVRLDQQLRDDLAAAELMTPEIRQAAERARLRGAEVVVAGNFLHRRIRTSELADLLDIAVNAIDSAADGDRVRLTATENERHILRLTISRPGVSTPSLDLKLGEGLN